MIMMMLCTLYFQIRSEYFNHLQNICVFVKRPGMNIFVAFFVLLILLADNTPPASSTIPLIGQLQCSRLCTWSYFHIHCESKTVSFFVSSIILSNVD